MLFEAVSPGVAAGLIVVWLAVLGGAVGSFLNVVVYRLPAGMSLVLPASHCPLCKTPIRWHDNVPVLGWLFLRGRCRDCQAPISARYPLVEGLTAALFVFLLVVECFSQGSNLPLRTIGVSGQPVAAAPTLGQLAAIYVYHLWLLCTLLADALIQYDGHAVPRRLALPAIVVGCAAPVAWPFLHPVPAFSGIGGWSAGLIDTAAGLAAGAVTGLLLRPIVQRNERMGITVGSLITGIFLGWQAAVVLSLLTAAAGVMGGLSALVFRKGRQAVGWHAVTRRSRGSACSSAAQHAHPPLRGVRAWHPTVGALGWLTVLATGWIVFWRPLVSRWPWLG